MWWDLQTLGCTFSKGHLILSTPEDQAGLAQSKFLHTMEGHKIPVVHIKNMLWETACIIPALGKGKLICGEVQGVPQGDLILGEQK